MVRIAAVTALFSALPGLAGDSRADTASDVAVKAALLFNFAKFTIWPSLGAGAPILFCIAGSAGIAAAFTETVRGQTIEGHPLNLGASQDRAVWPTCNVLFISETEFRRTSAGLEQVAKLPVLTVSDSSGFATGAGIIELYLENGRMRFAINVDAAEGSGLHLSSRLLGLQIVQLLTYRRQRLDRLARICPNATYAHGQPLYLQ